MKPSAARLLAWFAVALLAWTDPSWAVDPGPADKALWQSRYGAVLSERNDARREFEAVRAHRTRERHRGRLRGEARTAADLRLREAQQRLASAERDWQDFPSRARRAGALPGWFR